MVGRVYFILLLLGMSIFSIWSSFQKEHIGYQENKGYQWEQYDPSYFNKFQSIQDIIDTANYQFEKSLQGSVEYFNFIAEIIRKRFYHGFSTYSVSENYLAAYAGKLIWDDLSCIVFADDIMKYPMAACSQQALVLAEIFKASNINYRKIGFPNHFCIEAFIENEWRFFDTNMEPRLTARQPFDSIVKNKKFLAVYSHLANNQTFKNGTTFYSKGKTNEEFAPNAKLFHRVTRFLSSPYVPTSILLLLLAFHFKALYRRIPPKAGRKDNDDTRATSKVSEEWNAAI